MIRIGLLWHSVNSENLGVGALTVANIAIIEKIAAELGQEVSLKILGWPDPSPTQLSKPNLSVARFRSKDLIRPSGLYREVRECDFVLDISAGDSFSDIYGGRRFAFNILSKLAVLFARRPLINSPQTIGPFKLWWARAAARFLLKRSAAVVTRDGLSTAYAKSLGIADAVEATDVAMRLPYTKSARLAGPKIKVGVNISGWLFDGSHNQDKMVVLNTDYPAMSRALIKHFSELADCEVHLVSHVIGGYQDDYAAAEKLAKEFPGAIVAPRFADPSSAKSYISGLDFFFGSRMHACIAAFSSGVPVVPIAYSRKFSGLFSSLGYNATVDCMDLTADEIVSKVIAGFASRAELKKQVAASLENADAKLAKYEDVIRRQIKRFASGSRPR